LWILISARFLLPLQAMVTERTGPPGVIFLLVTFSCCHELSRARSCFGSAAGVGDFTVASCSFSWKDPAFSHQS
jgi:hypothetical protein